MMVSAVQSSLTNAALIPAAVDNQISAAIAGKALDDAREQGAAVLELLDAAAGSGGTKEDTGMAQATSLGGNLDVTG
jgi:hypothetical protein